MALLVRSARLDHQALKAKPVLRASRAPQAKLEILA